MRAVKIVLYLLLLGVMTVFIALAANRALWGYWGISTPTLREAAAVKGGVLDGAALVRIADQSFQQVVLNGPETVDLDLWRRNGVPVTVGFERWLLEFASQDRDKVRALPTDAMNELWALTRKAEGDPVVEAEYRESANRGWVLFLRVRVGGATSLVVAHRTSEVANDRYFYGETGFRADKDRYLQWGRARYWFEISNREWFNFRNLVGLSACLVAALGMAAVALVRRRLNRD